MLNVRFLLPLFSSLSGVNSDVQHMSLFTEENDLWRNGSQDYHYIELQVLESEVYLSLEAGPSVCTRDLNQTNMAVHQSVCA